MIISLIAAQRGIDERAIAASLRAALSTFGSTHLLYQATPEQLTEASTNTRFLLLAGGQQDAPWRSLIAQRADELLLVSKAGEDPDLETHHTTSARRTLLLLQQRQPSQTRKALRTFQPDRHLHHQETQGDFSRLARMLAGESIGLCLGAGGARAAAQIGAIRALRDAHVEIDHVGGTSAGAMIAAMVALRFTPEQILETSLRLVKKNPFRDFVLPITSLLSDRRAEESLREIFGQTQIEDLWLPFFCNACNLSTLHDDVFDTGDLVTHLMASSALPGVFPPRVINKCLYYDGGTINPLPGVEMKRRAPGRMIAIDSSAERELFFHEETYPTSWRALWRILKGDALMTLPQMFLRAVYSVPINHIRATRERSHLFLQPPVERFKTSQVSALREIEEIGFLSMKAALLEAIDKV